MMSRLRRLNWSNRPRSWTETTSGSARSRLRRNWRCAARVRASPIGVSGGCGPRFMSGSYRTGISEMITTRSRLNRRQKMSDATIGDRTFTAQSAANVAKLAMIDASTFTCSSVRKLSALDVQTTSPGPPRQREPRPRPSCAPASLWRFSDRRRQRLAIGRGPADIATCSGSGRVIRRRRVAGDGALCRASPPSSTCRACCENRNSAGQ